jgi:hypothetical protein
MKYIINTGCSYGTMFVSFREFTNGNDNDFRIIDLHCDSTGADYAKRSIIYTVSKLIENGIPPKDMYVITEWSQPNRLHIELPREFCDEILNDKPHTEKTFVLDNTFNRIENEFPINFVDKFKSLSTIFDDRVYANIEHSDLESFDNKNIKHYIKEFLKNSPINNKPIDRLESYLTNILDLQSFLKSLKIEYSFFLMNNTFEGYLNVSKYTDYTHFSSLNEIKEVLHKEKIILLNLSNQKQIKDFSDYLNKTWNLIDLSNFHFYQTDNFKFGGIDEYAMEKFGNISFVASHEPKDIPKHGYIVGFGAHPHESVYVNFFIDYMYDKLKPFIGELQFDFTDRWQFSKHNSIRKTK